MTAQLGEWKAGYRDGLNAALTVAKVCEQDEAGPPATVAEVIELIEALAESAVIAPEAGEPS